MSNVKYISNPAAVKRRDMSCGCATLLGKSQRVSRLKISMARKLKLKGGILRALKGESRIVSATEWDVVSLSR